MASIGSSYTVLKSTLENSSSFSCGFWYEKITSGTNSGKLKICFGIKRTGGTWTGVCYAGTLDYAKINGTNMTIELAEGYCGWGSATGSKTWVSGDVYLLGYIIYTPEFEGNTTKAVNLSYSIKDHGGAMIGEESGNASLPAITWDSGLPTYTVTSTDIDEPYDGSDKYGSIKIVTSDSDYTNIKVYSGTTTDYTDGLNGATPGSDGSIELTPGEAGSIDTETETKIYYKVVGNGYSTGTVTGYVTITVTPTADINIVPLSLYQRGSSVGVSIGQEKAAPGFYVFGKGPIAPIKVTINGVEETLLGWQV